MGSRIKVVIGGVNGRFGRASAAAVLGDGDLELVGAFGREGAPYVGQDVGELVSGKQAAILVSSGFQDILARVKPDVYLDFSLAEPAFRHGKMALEHGVRPVIATSGLGDKEVNELTDLAAQKKIGGLIAPNLSVGAVLMMEFAKQAAAMFNHVEIVEMHHTKKHDAPSGTAMHTVRKLASTGKTFNAGQVEEQELIPGARGGQGAAGVRVHSVRLPGLISHQEVIFGADGELLTLRHDGYNASCYMKGTLLAVKAVPGLDRLVVGLEHILNLNLQLVG